MINHQTDSSYQKGGKDMVKTKAKIKGAAKWVMSVEEMPHGAGFSYPVFKWTWQLLSGLKGGELRIWPQGRINFKSSREKDEEEYDFNLVTLRKVLKTGSSDLCGFGEPPYLEKVFKAVSAARKKFPAKDKDDTIRIFEKLGKKLAAITAMPS